ncbi:MAG: phosphoribosylamine--glycine ligase N-terminal domain-containing protein, partial [Pseudomonadota bacterium]|nr:phosphoribosylamine--glycine ligase N-terminal domain-containing protein [Pseudomonadota bacterium]
MKILIIGSGGREHALARSIFDSPLCDELIIAPGNPGIAQLGRCEAVSVEDTAALVELAKNEAADLVVVGPEVPLVNGLADDLIAADIPVFGPRAAAARGVGWRSGGRGLWGRAISNQPK